MDAVHAVNAVNAVNAANAANEEPQETKEATTLAAYLAGYEDGFTDRSQDAIRIVRALWSKLSQARDERNLILAELQAVHQKQFGERPFFDVGKLIHTCVESQRKEREAQRTIQSLAENLVGTKMELRRALLGERKDYRCYEDGENDSDIEDVEIAPNATT